MMMHQLTHQFSIAKYWFYSTIHRYRLALAYAQDRIDHDQANEIIYDCQAAAGWFPLETFSVERCLQTALDCHWEPHPELASLVLSACDRVASKWSSVGHAADAAEDWALDRPGFYCRLRTATLAAAAITFPDDPAPPPG